MRHARGKAGYCGATEVVPEIARVSALAGFGLVQRPWKRRTCTEMRHARGKAGYCGATEVVPEIARVSALAGFGLVG
ncbi:hypothetical protein GOBAR_DD15181 [Gossypium barbadense]|nr:hypothetical protein GOBAR_DD15181 [Gossypium barbadense]